MENSRSSSSATSLAELTKLMKRRGTKRRRERSASPCKRRRTSASPTRRQTDYSTRRRANYAASRARRAVTRAALIVQRGERMKAELKRQREVERQERLRNIERAARLSDVYLMRSVMINDAHMAVRDQRISALAARLGGLVQVDFLYVKAHVEASHWSLYVHPATRAALHRLCAIEGGDALFHAHN